MLSSDGILSSSSNSTGRWLSRLGKNEGVVKLGSVTLRSLVSINKTFTRVNVSCQAVVMVS